MRLLIYNIAYGTGAATDGFRQIFTIHRYLRTSRSHLDRIVEFIDQSAADVVGLVEVDTGSYRTRHVNQVEVVANHLKHFHHSSNKYGRNSIGRAIPFLKDHANAILTRDTINASAFHYFPVGFKKLIIEVEVRGVKIFLVHLALKKRVRERQLTHLANLASDEGPVIIAGDFNTFKGELEIDNLRDRLGLSNPNRDNLPTYPSWDPKRQLDFILCSKSIKVNNFQVGDVRYSDHLPVILDFNI